MAGCASYANTQIETEIRCLAIQGCPLRISRVQVISEDFASHRDPPALSITIANQGPTSNEKRNPDWADPLAAAAAIPGVLSGAGRWRFEGRSPFRTLVLGFRETPMASRPWSSTKNSPAPDELPAAQRPKEVWSRAAVRRSS